MAKADDETYESRAFREALQDEFKRIGRIIESQCPKGIGFAVFLFPFGDKGNVAYMSNGQRADIDRNHRRMAGQGQSGGA